MNQMKNTNIDYAYNKPNLLENINSFFGTNV